MARRRAAATAIPAPRAAPELAFAAVGWLPRSARLLFEHHSPLKPRALLALALFVVLGVIGTLAFAIPATRDVIGDALAGVVLSPARSWRLASSGTRDRQPR